MKPVWIVADSIASPLGISSEENYQKVIEGQSGIQSYQQEYFGPKQVSIGFCANLKIENSLTRFESLSLSALDGLERKVNIPKEKTLFILSTTKGNIELLEKGEMQHARLPLHRTAKFLADKIGIGNHLVVSNACTSGVVALIVAKRYIEAGLYDNVVVLGADVISRFVIAGFQSLNALSVNRCKPFDASRKGINLGEAAAAVLVTAYPEKPKPAYQIELLGGAITNDANHISGPSKTGEELADAIQQTFQQSNVTAADIDFISAHGTATLYNDEMEAKAFTISGLSNTPLHSLKGNFGHTLGAAGVVETSMSIHSLLKQELIPSLGFETLGVSQPLNIIQERKSHKLRRVLKTSSGFGGCNAAIIIQLP